jgi:hypothetical protein
MADKPATILKFPERPDPAELGGIADINAQMASVEMLGTLTTLNIPPDRVLDGAKGQLDEVLLLGWDKNGDPYVATSIAGENGIARMGDLANRFLHKLYNGDYCL